MLGFELLSNGSLHVVAFFTTLLSANRPTPLIRFGIQTWILFHMIAVDNGWGGEDMPHRCSSLCQHALICFYFYFREVIHTLFHQRIGFASMITHHPLLPFRDY